MKNPTVQAFLLIGALAILGLCGLGALFVGGSYYYNQPEQAELRAKVSTLFNQEASPVSEPSTVKVVEVNPVEGVYPEPTIAETHPSSNEVVTSKSNGWAITYLPGSGLDRGDGSTFRDTFDAWNFRKIAPELWSTFPNVPNPEVPGFRVVNGNEVPDGLEYAMDESNFCQQLGGEDCQVPVAAMHYFLFTGDYKIPGIGECQSTDGIGCSLIIVNVGDVTADITGMFAQGFRLHARYWNGEALDMAMWALSSHVANNMLNMDSKLNPEGIQNAGANCSVPNACDGVFTRIVFISGNEPLVKLETTVER